MNTRIVLVDTAINPHSFQEEECPDPLYSSQKLVVELVLLGMNAGMRSRLGGNNPGGGQSGIPLGGVPNSDAVVRVRQSSDSRFPVGSLALRQWSPWQRLSSCEANELIPVPQVDPLLLVTLLGHTGKTAWEALRVAELSPTDHIVVSAAAGGVGTALIQFAAAMGARVSGIASGKRCEVVESFGVSCIDRDKGIDLHDFNVYHDAIGGPLLEHVIERIDDGGRIIICGALDGRPPRNYRRMIHHDIQLRGYSVINHPEREPFMTTVQRWIDEKKIRPVATQFDGLEQAGEAFCSHAPGRHVVRVM